MGVGLVAVTALTDFSGLQTDSHLAHCVGIKWEGLLLVAGPWETLFDQPLHQEVRAEVPAGVALHGQDLGWCCSAWAVLDTPVQLCSLLLRETRALQCSRQPRAQLHAFV